MGYGYIQFGMSWVDRDEFDFGGMPHVKVGIIALHSLAFVELALP